ncbi:hypothetical protein L3X38_033622 [Prunus dulcis]|uniref:non-specific serine/threonine protein kinase n=1 Tax=Prunus dulcis TaxID=3755 RepID=A0AAD4YX44_PRUDU|nr:hypothetical protein L3X38_033622 [Prunus dulcis]
MAPEYVMHGQFYVKSVVYSFGVLILEIVSGQKNSCFRCGENEGDLLSDAWKSWREGTASNLIDPTLRTATPSVSLCPHSQHFLCSTPLNSTCLWDRRAIPGGDDTDEIRFAESLQFDSATIRVSTDDFFEANKLGEDGFGSVYRGRLFNGEDIAVKRLSTNSGHGDLELKNELIVYEYVPNASLDHIMFAHPRKRAQLDWERRYKIIVGSARGLLYLHEDSPRLRIIHCDLKASNILIDAVMNPKISDFGMIRLFVPDQTQGNTSRIVGTYGYIWLQILEIVNGQKISCFQHGDNMEGLLSFAWRSWREGTASNLIDPTLKTDSRNEIMRCIHIGLLRVQENVADRPTMASVNIMTNSYSLTLPVPSQPAFYLRSSIGLDMSLRSEYNSGATRSDRSKSNSVNVMEYETFTEPHPR